MASNLSFQRLHERARLITGRGDPNVDRFCIMSFVAFLAGEWFGDRPHAASPVIRRFVIPLNDRMDDAARQRLKPFAPRILGTNDRHDAERAALLYEAVKDEFLPAGLTDARQRAACTTAAPPAWLERLSSRADAADRAAAAALDRPVQLNVHYLLEADEAGDHGVLAKETGHMIAGLAAAAPDRRRRVWYWGRAIDLLDRLCDIGADERSLSAPETARVL